MMRKLCEAVGNLYAKHDRRRVISSEDYMIRHYLLFLGQEFDDNGEDKRRKKLYPYNAFLHEIRGSDEPVYHDHPWPYVTIILTGGYYEHTPVFDAEGFAIADSCTWHGPGSILKRPANSFHYLERGHRGSTWTLFLRGRRVQDWGFLPYMTKEKVAWKEWTRMRQEQGFVR